MQARVKYMISMILLFVTIFNLTSCKKFIEVTPPITSINGVNVYTSDATASAVLTGIYTKISNENFTNGVSAISLYPALGADELTLFDLSNGQYSGYYRNALTKDNAVFWNALYSNIFTTNSAIEGLNSNENKLTQNVHQQLLGEAKLLRAFFYYYLVNLYGDVPLVLSTDANVNRLLPRSSKEEVYQTIINDLRDAQGLLSPNYLRGDLLGMTTERVRPTMWAATALLSRVYLFKGDWQNAESEANKVILNTSMYDTVSLSSGVFNKNSKEAIWQLQPTGSGTNSNTKDGRFFILPSTGPNGSSFPVYLSNFLVNSFELGDKRKLFWIGSVKPTPSGTITYYYPNKYKIGSVNTTTQEYVMILRLAEQYLIRAEARAQQNNLIGAQNDLNVIRKRSGLGNISTSDKLTLISAILKERQVELFTEWGHRWFDLIRSSTIDSVMNLICPQKGGVWSSNWALYPIPQNDIDKNINLNGQQNPGY